MHPILTILLTLSLSAIANSQNLCNFTTSPNLTTYNFVNNFSANKCLRVANFGHFPDSKIFLDECSWWKTATKDQLFSLSSNKFFSDANVFVIDAGLDQHYCMTTKDEVLLTNHCRQSEMDSIWRVKPITGQENQVLIQQVSSSKCLVPNSRATRSLISLAPCNSYKTEQIWKICTYSNSTV